MGVLMVGMETDVTAVSFSYYFQYKSNLIQ